MKKNKKKKYNGCSIIVLLIMIIVIIIAVWYFFFKQDPINITVISNIDNYGYYLESNATKIYKNNYYELEKLLKSNDIDEEKYVKAISKLFVIDFYTLNNKLSNQDIGGTQFIHKEILSSFKQQATNTTYKYIKNNLSGKRNQQLPEVSKVEILSIDNIDYTFNNQKYNNSYKVKIKVDYRKDLGWQQNIELVLIPEDNKLSIVEIN